ncbi:MAG: glycosyltransferase [Methylobacter sp.]|jgi:glycosyltransferase involved in cell wall biosynthesis|nr:glycosyltransferase [Methylobacter sp.]
MIEAAEPLVSICIPTYNAEKTIGETLRSIVSQSYRNLNIQIADNASTDGTLDIVRSFTDARISVHANASNIGAEANFERCFNLSRGKYTAIFHADDIYETGMVEQQVAFLESNPEAGAVFTSAGLIDEDGRNIGAIGLPKGLFSANNLYSFEDIFKTVLKASNFMICPSVMARTAVYQQEIQSWRGELFKSSADLDVWFRILQKHAVGILPQRLMRYRISSSQWSARTRMNTERADFFLVMDYYLAQEPVRSMLSASDFRNYALLERRDRVARAVNLFLSDRPKEAKELCSDVLSLDALYAAIQSKRGLVTLIAGIGVKLLAAMGMNKMGKAPLMYMKQVTGK